MIEVGNVRFNPDNELYKKSVWMMMSTDPMFCTDIAGPPPAPADFPGEWSVKVFKHKISEIVYYSGATFVIQEPQEP